MPNPNKSSRQGHGGKDPDDSHTPSNSLWVGNLPSDVTDSDLMGLFAKYGALDCITSYSSRSYAFVFFKRVEDAKAAKDVMEGTVLRGNPIRIEFARPARPCEQLWVGGISPSVTREKLEEEFLKFGKIEDFRLFRDRSTAYVEYVRLEDASQALKSMNGKRIGGDQLRVDFLRSQQSRREQWPDFHDPRDGQFFSRSLGPSNPPWMPQDSIRNYSESAHSGPKRHQSQSSGLRKGDGQPSNVLWIGYPPDVQIDEQMIHNAMILFGEIERIKSFPDRNYSFVEFRSVDEARRAKEGLQGRLFNDPRILILFSSSELARGKEFSGFYPGSKGPRPDIFYNDLPLPAHMEIFGHDRPMVPNNFPGPLPSSGILGPNMLMRPFGPQGSFEPLLSGPEFNDLAALRNIQDSIPNNLMGPIWRRPSPTAPRMLPSPAPGIRPPMRPITGAWDVFDANHFQRESFQRESKRSRIDGALPIEDVSLPLRKIDDRVLGMDQSYGLGPPIDGGAPALLANVRGKNHHSPVETRATTGGPSQVYSDNDYIWRGVIAKGGTPVCHARCVPVGKGIGSEIPEVVNCSARTGLDMLTKHYAEAIGFDVVYFLPDSEDDFASYTEFLRYLGVKNRAGVAKLDDGTTLFLVPPSDFLTKVLNVTGPERLYGVVLKLPQQVPTGVSMLQQTHQPLPSSQYIDRQRIAPQTEYSVIPRKEERVLHMDYNKVLNEGSKLPPKPLLPPANESLTLQSAVPQEYASINTAVVSQAGVTLTPELIATLASLLPANTQSSAFESSQPPLVSSTLRPSFPSSMTPDRGIPSQGWTHDYRSTEQTGHPPQQLGNQFNPQAQLSHQLQTYPTVSNTPSHSAQVVLGSTQIQDRTFNLPQQAAVSSRPLTNFAVPSQSGQFATSQLVNQQYQLEVPHNAQRGYGMVHGTDAPGFYGSPGFQQSTDPASLSNPVHGVNFSQAQTVMPLAADKVSPEFPSEVQQLQSVLYGSGQGTSEVEVDKNQRYQSTLQFAASLLLQLQQQQPPTSTQAGQGSGNQQ